MKDLKEYINESKTYTLNDYERDALTSVVGVLCGALGDDELEKLYKPIKDDLTDKEIAQLDSLYDMLEDTHVYRRIKISMMSDEVPLLIKIIEYMDDEDLWSDGNDYELINILDELKH